MNEEEVREKCVQLAELSGALTRQNMLLRDYIDNIAAIIAYQSSLKDQDMWMADMIKEGLYNPDDELLDILIEDGRYRYKKPKQVD